MEPPRKRRRIEEGGRCQIRALPDLDEVVLHYNKTGWKVVKVGLAAVHLTWEVYKNMKRWWNEEISGERCAKNCIDIMSQTAAATRGAVVGARLGEEVLPGVGSFIGGILGGLLSGYLAKVLSDAITQKIFDLPKDEALENAFKFLGIHHTASDNEINRKFHRLCLKYHPDKGGRAEDFHLLQFYMSVIKLEREEN